jgi:hypothetical protein
MERLKAANIIDLLTKASSEIAEALELFRDEVNAEDFKEHAKATGDVLATVACDLIRPVCREYPDLDPDCG